MTAVTAGTTASFTLAFPASITFTVEPAEIVLLHVTRGGRAVFASPIYQSSTFGPFAYGDVVSITAQRGAAEYDLIRTTASNAFTSSAPFARLRTIPELAFLDADTRSYRQIWQIPATGYCQVRAGYETDNTSAGSITNVAFAAGRAMDDNPLDAAGAAATWTAITGPALSAASATLSSDGRLGYGVSSFVTLDVPAAADGSGGGFVYVGTQTNSASKRWHTSLPSIEYETYVSTQVPSLKYRSFANASGDNVSANQNAFVNAAVGGSAFLRGYHAAAWIDVISLTGSIMSFTMCGDSTFAGYNTTGQMSYAPGTVVAGLLNSAGIQCVMNNIGSVGAGARYYNQRLRDAIANDSSFRPDFVVIQPFTSNDGFTAAAITAGIGRAIETAQLCAARGIRVFLSTVTAAAGDDAAKIAARNAGNAQVKASPYPVIDIDSILTNPATGLMYTSLSTDGGTHYTKAADDLVAGLYKRVIGNVFGVANG